MSEGNGPDFDVFSIREREGGGKDIFVKVGVAFQRKNAKGMTIMLDALRTLLLRYILLWPLPLLGALLVQLLSGYTGYASTDLLIVFTPFLNFIWTWFDKDQQFLHDRLSKTRLIDARPTRVTSAAT